MSQTTRRRVALVYPGDREARRNATPENSRFLNVFQALAAKGLNAEPAIYHDDFCDELRRQLLQVDGVLVWVNPIEGGRDRSMLDALLREVAAAGVFVSTHPDIILKLGTKEVLYRTRELGWGSDIDLYASFDDLRRELPRKLLAGQVRVLKQYRGQSGDGVWRVELVENPGARATSLPEEALVHARHAKRGAVEAKITLREFFALCERYFAGAGKMIDQLYQPRLPEGMIRCYLVHDRVEGFGHQAINALYPAPPGAPRESALPPGPRLYHPPTVPAFQPLKHRLENEWLPAAQRLLGIPREQLPVLWDCDFMFGPKTAAGEDTYVLCEINVSSVSPFPESAAAPIARAMRERLQRS
ncbi:MAG: Cj0069 family protein [Betaproteobacteria bacterium]|nr:Cj0069 family protein [Betaproteobacteria bacterium]